MRRAIVDIGSNTTRLYIADVEDGRITQELERQTKVTRLGAGVDTNGRLSEDGMQRVFATLSEYKRLIDRHHAEDALAVLTSATRDAANGAAFATTVRERYAIEPHVLAGEEEAQLSFLGATSDRDPDSTIPTLVIDIGGGSTELIIGRARSAEFFVSTQAGVVRQTERHLHSDPPTAEEQAAVSADARMIVESAVPNEHRRAVEHAIAVAGTATSLAAIAQNLDPYDPAKVHGYVLATGERDAIRDRLASMTLEDRRHVTGLDPARAPTIVAGVLILTEVMNLFGLDRIEVSEHDILRGAALGL